MPKIYISPSTQNAQLFVTGNGNEEYFTNLVADAMIPYLRASGIEFTRSNPGADLQEVIEQSNAGAYDAHLALNTDLSPEYSIGTLQGPNVTYYTGSPGGKVLSGLIAEQLRTIYPTPELVSLSSNRLLQELRDTDAAAAMVFLGYRDNLLDAVWIEENIQEIGRSLVMALAEYFALPFVDPASAQSSQRMNFPER